MKCPECGSTQLGMYKEVRGIIAEMGITKEDIREQINKTVDAMVRSAVSENIHSAIAHTVDNKIRSYGYNREFNTLLEKAIGEQIGKIIRESADISISLKKKE